MARKDSPRTGGHHVTYERPASFKVNNEPHEHQELLGLDCPAFGAVHESLDVIVDLAAGRALAPAGSREHIRSVESHQEFRVRPRPLKSASAALVSQVLAEN